MQQSDEQDAQFWLARADADRAWWRDEVASSHHTDLFIVTFVSVVVVALLYGRDIVAWLGF